MNTEVVVIRVSNLEVQIVRKNIKNLHLGVYPPNGRVRVAAPLAVSNQAVRLAVVSRLGWIKRQQARFAAQSRQSAREMVTGESHYYLGRRYRLRIVQNDGPGMITLRSGAILEVHTRRNASVETRQRILSNWYRERLRELIPPLLSRWEAKLGIHSSSWGIKKMKTRWGSCTIDARRLWLNLELAKKPAKCLEFVIVHELAHLLERHHNDRFISIMDKHMRKWRLYRHELNSAPLAHETWSY